MEQDWWEFYSTGFYAHRVPSILKRNLNAVRKSLEKELRLACEGLEYLNEAASSSNPQNFTWSQMVENGRKQESLFAHSNLPHDNCTSFKYELTPVRSEGERVTGVACLKIRQDFDQLVKWNSISCDFIINDAYIFLCCPIEIVGPAGKLTLEIIIEGKGISCECEIINGKCTFSDFQIVFEYYKQRHVPVVTYCKDDDSVLAQVDGYRCPFTNKKFDKMQDLLRYHADFHINLGFYLHPSRVNGILVEELPQQLQVNNQAAIRLTKPPHIGEEMFDIFVPSDPILMDDLLDSTSID